MDLDLPTLVKNRRGELGMSFEELYLRSDCPMAVLRQIEDSPGRNLPLLYIANVAAALDLPLDQVCKAALRSLTTGRLPKAATLPPETLPLFNPRTYQRQQGRAT